MRPWQGRTQDDALKAAWQELAAQAKEKPWLLKLLAARGTALAARYALWMGRLRRLRQGERRRLQRRLGVGLAGAALLLALAGGPAGASPANTITVSGACDLIEAIHNANDTTTGQPYTDCAAGDPAGADSIYLTGPVTLTASNNVTYGPTGLPVVTSEITIEGNGNTIARSGATVDFRILAVGSGGNLTLNSVTVSGGVASASSPGHRGGGIYAVSATVAVSNSTLSGNSAVYGGGIRASFATVTVSNSTLSGNSAGFAGGGIGAASATVSVTNSTLSGNSAGFGGGLYARSATLAVTNSTLSGNSAGFGGGLYAIYATVEVTNSTLSGNSASNGGGINAGSATVAVSRSLVSGNAAGTGREVRSILSTITAANYNLFGHSGETDAQAFTNFTPGATDINATSSGTPYALAGILDTALVNNGVQPHPDTHALVSGSPAIDKATNASCTAAPTNNVDERGGVRNVDGNASASTNECDIGAFEYGSTQTPTAITLQSFTAAGESGGGVPVGWAAALLAGLGGLGLSAFVARRRSWRRRDSGPTPSLLLSPPAVQGSVPPPAYTAPAITQRSRLRQFSGSPLTVDPLNLSE